MEGVGQHHLVAELLDLGGRKPLDGGRGCERDEGGRLEVAVRGRKNARARAPVVSADQTA
jgi:hypothetical protein